jgi:hypothetical protein
MVKDSPVNRIARAYAQDEKAEQRMIALGIPKRKIYRADKGQTLGRFSMRKGEFLGVVGGVRGLITGDSKKAIDDAVDKVHGWGATVLDIETGFDSRTHGVKMFRLAFAPKGPEPEVAHAMQEAAAKARRNGQMPIEKAETIWDDPRYHSLIHALEAMGWKQATAYTYFGPRFSRATRKRPWAEKQK